MTVFILTLSDSKAFYERPVFQGVFDTQEMGQTVASTYAERVFGSPQLTTWYSDAIGLYSFDGNGMQWRIRPFETNVISTLA